MWRDYFPFAQIFGIDNVPELLFQEERIHTELCDATDIMNIARVVSKLGADFDAIIEDADHITEHQILTAHALLPFLSEHGVYIIEDVTEPGKLSEAIHFPHQINKFKHDTSFKDDCLFIIEAPNWQLV
jgi:hypothetical protein